MANYYDILGVNKNASDDDIKKAYKKLVVKWHPDRWVNGTEEEKKTAEDKIKEINEAYSVLSDPEKKKNYDLFGTAEGIPGGGGGGFSPFEDDFDPFDMLRKKSRVEKGEDVQATVYVTIEEAYKGVKNKEIEIAVPKPCSHCNGTGSADGKKHECPYCHGTGLYVMTQNHGNVIFQQSTTCPYCHGTGKDANVQPCKHCHGSGSEMTKKTISISVPAGVFDGAQMKLNGLGASPKSGSGVNGDVILLFRVSGDTRFSRVGDDLVYTLELTLLEAWDGCDKKITLLGGESLTVNVPKGSRDGNELRYRGRGFQNLSSPWGGVGDFVVLIKYKVPEKITKEQRKLLEQFYEIGK